MSRRSIRMVILLVALVMALGGLAAQEKKDQLELKPLEAPVKQQLTLEKKAKKTEGSTPSISDQHDILGMMAGRFRAEARIYPAPGVDPIESRGMTISELIMGGRFLQTKFKGDMNGRSFEGMALDGYDVDSGKHRSVWIDSMGTAIQTFEGTADKTGRVLTLFSESVDPESGKTKTTKGVTTIRSHSLFTYEAWEKLGDGEFFKTMEVRYTRM